MGRFLALGLHFCAFLAASGLHAEPPAPPECLRILEGAFENSLPTRFTARSQLAWPSGSLTHFCTFHGDHERSFLRTSSFSVRTYRSQCSSVEWTVPECGRRAK